MTEERRDGFYIIYDHKWWESILGATILGIASTYEDAIAVYNNVESGYGPNGLGIGFLPGDYAPQSRQDILEHLENVTPDMEG